MFTVFSLNTSNMNFQGLYISGGRRSTLTDDNKMFIYVDMHLHVYITFYK